FASAAHSGRQAKTFNAANTGEHASINAAAPVNASHLMSVSFQIGCAQARGMFEPLRAGSELVRAVRAETHDVLQEDLVIGFVEPGLVARELQPEARELRRREVDHRGGPLGIVWLQKRKIGRGQRSTEIRDAAVKFLVAQAPPPARHELI